MTAGRLDRKWAGLSQGDQGTWAEPRRGGLNLPLSVFSHVKMHPTMKCAQVLIDVSQKKQCGEFFMKPTFSHLNGCAFIQCHILPPFFFF